MTRKFSCAVAVLMLFVALMPQIIPLTAPQSVRSAPIVAPVEFAEPNLQSTDPPLGPDVPTCLYLGPNYSPTPHWTLNAAMPTARFGFALIAPNGLSSMYAIGGLQDGANTLAVNERYNACTDTWETLAPLPEPRAYIQAAELNGRIYIVGGVDRAVSGAFAVQRSVWVYDPKINFWSWASDLPQALGGVALATANGKLYAFGGFDSRGPGSGEVDTVYEYTPSTDRWSLRGTMPGGARSLAGAAQLNGEIYVAGGLSGGLTGLSRVEVYNPGSRTWRTAQGISDGHYGLSLIAAPDGFLYALGGSHFNNDEWYAQQRYDPGTDTWDFIDSPIVNDYYNHGMSSGTYAVGRLFLIGGVGQTYGPAFSNTTESMHILNSLCESTLRAAPDSVAPGGRITYTIELRGEVNPLPNVILLDPIPHGTTFAGFVGDPAGAHYNAGENQVEWHNPLPANSPPITITFRVSVNVTGWTNAQLITNTLTIHNGLNVIARSASTWIDAFDLSPSIKRVDTTQTTAGERQTYRLRVQTTSPISGAVTLSDPVPFAVDYIADTLTSTSGMASYANGVIKWSGNLIPHLQTYTNASGDYQWGDSLGNGEVPGVKYAWIEIEQTGRPYGFFSPNNDRCYHTAFPFDFHFYDLHRTTASISTNGTLYFPDPSGYTNYLMGWDNLPIPSDYFYSGHDINHFIAPFWDDLNLMPGWIYYQVFGEAPQRRVVIEFANVTRRADAGLPGKPGSFEMIFYEGSSAIQFQYKDVDFGNALYDSGASATVGIQGSATNGIEYSYNTPALSDRLAILFVPPNKTITYTADYVDIDYTVGLSRIYPDQTPIVNTATITSSFGQVITRETVSLYRWPNFASSFKAVDRSVAQPSDEVTVTITADNTSVVPGIAEITDVIPQGMTYVAGSLSSAAGYGHYADGLVWWRLQVPPLSRTPIQFRVTIDDDVMHRQMITNTAVITTADYNVVLPASAQITVDKPADLFAVVTGPGALTSSAPFTYTIKVGNHGPFAADTPLILTDTLPSGVAFLEAASGGVYSSTGHIVTWTIGALEADVTQTLTLTVMLLEAPVGMPLTNTITLQPSFQDDNLLNNTGHWVTRIGSVPNLLNGTNKTIDRAIIHTGDVVTYAIVVMNTGGVSATTTITDPIPSGVTYQPGSSTVNGIPQELYNATANAIQWTGTIAMNEAVQLSFSVAITAAGGRVRNVAYINDGTWLTIERVAEAVFQNWTYLPLVRR